MGEDQEAKIKELEQELRIKELEQKLDKQKVEVVTDNKPIEVNITDEDWTKNLVAYVIIAIVSLLIVFFVLIDAGILGDG